MTVYAPLAAKRDGKPLMEYIREAQYGKLDKNGQKRKQFDLSNPERLRADDIVTIVYKDQKPITGQILVVKRQGIASDILIRNKVGGVGIDMHIPVFHPNILRVDVVRRPVNYRPRNRHYYIKNSRLDVGDVGGR
ncbi:DEKNAAC104145 [Brettanomyces naardenensis]|uniref:DEKNAAC104145 n=1 Tax=Brettanomyces naardenensis TaxID=13370 RepID=A0A448YQJ9_BRENA|nr:DEKNAAC104145 [Brettanomyces naardenensis]